MTDNDAQRPHNGWVPPDSRQDRLPPYAPRPQAAADPTATPTGPAEVTGPTEVSEPIDQPMPTEPAEPTGEQNVVGLTGDPSTEYLPQMAADAMEPAELPPAQSFQEPALLSGQDAHQGRAEDLSGSEEPTRWIPTVSDADLAWSDAADPEIDSAGSVSAPPPTRTKDPIRTIARGVGQTLITMGVIVLLFVVYEVYVTDIFGARKQAQATEKVDQVWEQAHAATAGPVTVTAVTTVPPPDPVQQEVDPAERKVNYDTTIGDGFAKIFIPAFGPDYAFTIVEGTNADDLYTGPGHYEGSQLPGELGNFAVAGHRVSKGSPFKELGDMASCDAMVVETQDDWFVYRVLPMADELGSWNPRSRPECADVKPLEGAYAGIPGREITSPSDYPQVHAIPHSPADEVSAATERMITLTTCHPLFSDAERMIIHGVLVKSYAKADGFFPPELKEG